MATSPMQVYAFSRKQGPDWLIPIKGASQSGKPIATFPKTKNKKGNLSHSRRNGYRERVRSTSVTVFLSLAQATVTGRSVIALMRITSSRPRQKRRCVNTKHGVAYFEWDAKKKRNEALDCRVYALTAVRILQQHRGLDLEPAGSTAARA